MREISWTAEELSASHERFFYMKLVGTLFSSIYGFVIIIIIILFIIVPKPLIVWSSDRKVCDR